MRTIAKLPPDDRRALFTNTAGKAGMTVAIVEKDFWVCWTLDYLFHRCKWKENLAFKGGRKSRVITANIAGIVIKCITYQQGHRLLTLASFFTC